MDRSCVGLSFEDRLLESKQFGQVFSPEDELERIKGLPKKQKREEIALFKDKLRAQRIGLASCRISIERLVEIDNDVPREILVEQVKKYGDYFGFSRKQIRLFERIIDRYYLNRRRILELRRRYPDDVDLVNELTGMHFDKKTKFEVSIGPMSIDITAKGVEAGKIYSRSRLK